MRPRAPCKQRLETVSITPHRFCTCMVTNSTGVISCPFEQKIDFCITWLITLNTHPLHCTNITRLSIKRLTHQPLPPFWEAVNRTCLKTVKQHAWLASHWIARWTCDQNYFPILKHYMAERKPINCHRMDQGQTLLPCLSGCSGHRRRFADPLISSDYQPCQGQQHCHRQIN